MFKKHLPLLKVVGRGGWAGARCVCGRESVHAIGNAIRSVALCNLRGHLNTDPRAYGVILSYMKKAVGMADGD